MPEYYVEWNIEVYADSADEAVLEALEIMRDPNGTATSFRVINKSTGEDTLEDYDEVIHPELYGDTDGQEG